MRGSIALLLIVLCVAAIPACVDPGPGQGGCTGSCTELVQYDNMLAPKDIDTPFTGPYEVVIEGDPDFPSHTIIRPVGAENMPILSWGEGGCVKMGRSYAEMMGEVASYGILVIADGGPKMADMWNGSAGGTADESMGDALIRGIDYAIAKNDDPCSPLYQKVDTSKIGVSGQSCGGLMAMEAAADPRVNVVFIMSSGLFGANTLPANQEIYKAIHTPIIFMNGGPTDVGYPNAEADIEALDALNTVPVYWANLGIGHMGDILTDNGGQFGEILTKWLRYQFFADPECAAMFEGDNCGYCQDNDRTSTNWTMDKYNGAL